ncbi:unnamed protein product [Fusarium graminearum]|nr:unnamed protein product [Fusarium graminearum]
MLTIKSLVFSILLIGAIHADVTDTIKAKFDGETCNRDTIDDADWKNKRVGARHNGTCYPIDN